MLSKNTSGIFVNFGEGSEEKPGENLTLVKGVKTDMGKYWVTYKSDSAHPTKQLWFFNIHFQRKDGKEDFVLQLRTIAISVKRKMFFIQQFYFD